MDNTEFKDDNLTTATNLENETLEFVAGLVDNSDCENNEEKKVNNKVNDADVVMSDILEKSACQDADEIQDSADTQPSEGISAVEEVELTPEQIRINAAKETAKWYALHTFSGYENVAKENLEIVIEKNNLQDRIFDIIIPVEDVVEEKNGKRKVVTRKVMPGYIFVKMNYGDDIWHTVAARTRGITGFVGPKGRPLNLTQEEIRKMQLEKQTVIDISIAVNDKVEVLEGPLNGFLGTVLGVDASAEKCRVMVEMFGRETPVDLGLTQVRKIQA